MFIAAHPNISVNHNIKLLLTKLYERFGTPLKDWDIKINRGILTGLNEAFIIDENTRRKILDNCATADERERTDKIIRPILRGRDIKKDGYDWPGLYCILAYYGFHKVIDAYPSIYNHLLQYENALKQRGQVRYASSGKPKIGAEYPGQHHWLELDNNPRKEYLDDFNRQKILYSEIVKTPRFYLDNQDFIPEATTFIMSGEHLDSLVNYLNSPVIAWIFKTYYAGGGLGESGFRYKKRFVINLPIPRVFNDEITDRNICEMYQFTDEEIAFISSSVSPYSSASSSSV